MDTKKLPKLCPSCGRMLHVQMMHCLGCDTEIHGDYVLPPFMRLDEEDQVFILDFVLCGGSLKALAQKMELSYPSVRNRLDDVIEELERLVKTTK